MSQIELGNNASCVAIIFIIFLAIVLIKIF